MNIKSLVRLPWKIKDVVRAMRGDIAESRQAMAQLLQMIAALEARHGNLELRHGELLDVLQEKDERWERKTHSTHEELLAEIREQGLLTEIAARLPARAAAEMKLRDQLPAPLPRQPGVSVLITCWNHAGYLGVAVASAIATLDRLPVPGEVLILDDASRDGSRETGMKVASADERIRLISSAENLGLPHAHNVLLSQARFLHAMILDSDNQLVPSGVAALYESARQTGAVLAYGNIVQLDHAGSVTGVISNERVSPDLLKFNWIDAMALVRTDRVLELGGYDGQWLYGMEDWELNQRLYSLGERMVFVPVLVGKYTSSPLSMIHEAPVGTRHRRAVRIFNSGDAANSGSFRACVYHPSTGVLWAGAAGHRPRWNCRSRLFRDGRPHA